MLLFMTTSKSSFGQNKILRLHVITKYMTKTENDLYTEQLHYLTQSQCTMYNVYTLLFSSVVIQSILNVNANLYYANIILCTSLFKFSMMYHNVNILKAIYNQILNLMIEKKI